MAQRNLRKERVGIVVSNKMGKSIVVTVHRRVKHLIYGKFIGKSTKFMAHDEANACSIGDKVLITAARPLSRRKRWRISKIIEKAV